MSLVNKGGLLISLLVYRACRWVYHYVYYGQCDWGPTVTSQLRGFITFGQ